MRSSGQPSGSPAARYERPRYARPMPDPPKFIVVTGVGRVTAPPDRLEVTIGVGSTADTTGEALRAASERSTALNALLVELGIAEADRQTVNISVQHIPDQSSPGGFRSHATLMLNVTLRDVAAAGRLLDQAAQVAGDQLQVHGLRWSVADPEPHLALARRAAVEAAADQARQLAEAAGVGLGPIRTIIEGGGGPMGLRQRVGGMTLAAASTPVDPGIVGLSVQVEVTYDIE
jgi:uncharacterized protein YggE